MALFVCNFNGQVLVVVVIVLSLSFYTAEANACINSTESFLGALKSNYGGLIQSLLAPEDTQQVSRIFFKFSNTPDDWVWCRTMFYADISPTAIFWTTFFSIKPVHHEVSLDLPPFCNISILNSTTMTAYYYTNTTNNTTPTSTHHLHDGIIAGALLALGTLAQDPSQVAETVFVCIEEIKSVYEDHHMCWNTTAGATMDPVVDSGWSESTSKIVGLVCLICFLLASLMGVGFFIYRAYILDPSVKTRQIVFGCSGGIGLVVIVIQIVYEAIFTAMRSVLRLNPFFLFCDGLFLGTAIFSVLWSYKQPLYLPPTHRRPPSGYQLLVHLAGPGDSSSSSSSFSLPKKPNKKHFLAEAVAVAATALILIWWIVWIVVGIVIETAWSLSFFTWVLTILSIAAASLHHFTQQQNLIRNFVNANPDLSIEDYWFLKWRWVIIFTLILVAAVAILFAVVDLCFNFIQHSSLEITLLQALVNLFIGAGAIAVQRFQSLTNVRPESLSRTVLEGVRKAAGATSKLVVVNGVPAVMCIQQLYSVCTIDKDWNLYQLREVQNLNVNMRFYISGVEIPGEEERKLKAVDIMDSEKRIIVQ